MTDKGHLTFSTGEKVQTEVLRIEPGKITWTVDGQERVVNDEPMLVLALLDLLRQFTEDKYDYSKLVDEETWRKYEEFLATKKS